MIFFFGVAEYEICKKKKIAMTSLFFFYPVASVSKPSRNILHYLNFRTFERYSTNLLVNVVENKLHRGKVSGCRWCYKVFVCTTVQSCYPGCNRSSRYNKIYLFYRKESERDLYTLLKFLRNVWKHALILNIRIYIIE